MADDNLIFGYTWSEIQALQHKEKVRRLVVQESVEAQDAKHLEKDKALLAEFGEEALIQKGFHGTLARLRRAGLLSDMEDRA